MIKEEGSDDVSASGTVMENVSEDKQQPAAADGEAVKVRTLQHYYNIYDDALANWHTLNNERVKKSGPVRDWILGLLFSGQEFYHHATQWFTGKSRVGKTFKTLSHGTSSDELYTVKKTYHYLTLSHDV